MSLRLPFLSIFSFISMAAIYGVANAQVAIDQENPSGAWSCINTKFFTQTQTFTPSFDRMNFADVYLSSGSGGAADGEFSIRISRNGTLVQESKRLTIPALPSSGSQYHRFEFDRDVNFVRNSQYEMELVNHSGTGYFSWCQSQTDSYPGGAPNNDPPIGSETADFLFRTGMQSIYTTLQPEPVGGDYIYYESAQTPTAPSSSGISISDSFYAGLNFSVKRPTRISRLGASFGTGSQTIFGALFRATGFIDPPDSVDLTSSDVLATTLIDIPVRDFNGPPVEAFGEVEVVLEPGQYGVVFGSGLFGATGQSSLASNDNSYGFQSPYTFRTSDSMRFVSASDVRVIIEGDSLPGVAQARATYDAEAQLYNGTWVVIDGENETRPDLFPFYDIDARGLMEFPLDNVPQGAQVTSVRLELEPTQRSQNAQGETAEWVLHGFAGDGILDGTSPASPLNEIGRSDPIDSFDPMSIDMDAAYVQSLIDQGTTHLGLMVRGGDNGLSANYANWESGNPEKTPLLSIEFSLAADFDLDGDVDGHDLAKWQSDFGVNGNSDADGDGDTDGADLLLWQQQFGSGVVPLAKSQAVPEPHSLLLFFSGLALFARPRRAARA